MLIVLAIILILIDLYVYQGFLHFLNSLGLSENFFLIGKIGYWVFSLFVYGFFLLYRRRFAGKENKFGLRLLLSIGVGSVISKSISSLILIVDDVRCFILIVLNQMVNVPFDTSRSFISVFAIAFGFGLFLLLIYGILRNRHRYQLKQIQIPIKALHPDLDGLKIVHISDIHSGSFNSAKSVKPGIEMINDLDPDIVFFTGDLVNNVASEIDPYIDTFKKIRSKQGIYSILGNHDYGDYVRWPSPAMKTKNMQRLFEAHRKLGWELMLNEHRLVRIKESTLGIIGVENYSAKARFSKYGDLQKSTDGMPPADLKILLSHDPSHWDEEVTTRYDDIALTLSGHTHGMQFGFEISNWIKWSPVQYVYDKWAGLYQKNTQYLYVNRGFGYLGYPGRVGILPEITLLTLIKTN